MKLNLKNALLCTSLLTMLNTYEASAAPLYQPNYSNFINAVRNNDYTGVRKYFRPMFVNSKDGYGKTPLNYALQNDNYDISRFLMQNGANPYITDAEGYPAYCDARDSGNKNIKASFKGYNYGRCPEEFAIDKKAVLYTAGFAALVGGIAAAAGGGGGGSSSGGSDGGDNGSGNGNTDAEILKQDYGQVGYVDELLLTNILNQDGYTNSNISSTYSNADDYNLIRLAYSLARGYMGDYRDTPETPYFMDGVTATPQTITDPFVKVAVVDTGVNSQNSILGSNIVTGLAGSNLAYEQCQADSGFGDCSGVTYTQDDANPNATYSDTNSSWHGTAVATLIAGQYSSDIMGVAPMAKILPYRVTLDDGKFVSQAYIGQAFTSAAAAGAVVINNSWGTGVFDNEDEDLYIISAGDGATAANYISTNLSDMTTAMADAVTNNDVTFIFAAGNDGYTESSVENAIPLYNSVFQNGTEYKNFITVVAYDTDKNELASYSNQCGVAKNYCLTAPGTAMVSSGYENGDLSTDSNILVDGTSFAAPIVSGAYAVLKGAFPYLTGAEITKLMFVTARDLGDEGVDEVYGWGMLDLERATRPVGATLVPVDSRVDDRNFTVASTSFKLTPLLANNIQAQNLTAVYLDNFNRTFEFDVNDKIEIVSDRPELNDMFDRFTTSRLKPVEFKNNQDVKFYSGAHQISRNSSVAREFKISYNTENTTNKKYGFNFYYGNNPYNSFMDNDVEFYNNYALSTISNHNILNPYFRNDSQENYGFNNRLFINDKTAFNFGFLYQNYTPNTQKKDYEGIKKEEFGESMAVISSLSYSPSKYLTTTAEFGLLNEKETLFASKTSGAFGLGNNNQTYYFGLQNDMNITNAFSLIGRANFGYTKVNTAKNSLVENVSDIYTNSFALGFNYNLINEAERKSNISFIVAQSLRINSGEMSLRLPKSRDANGNLYYQNYDIDMKGKSNLDYQISYSYQTANQSEFTAGALFSSYTENAKKVDEGVFMFNYIKAF
ncbi:MAG: S8 family serine peptidase [Alphaproteobacteria bacterium]